MKQGYVPYLQFSVAGTQNKAREWTKDRQKEQREMNVENAEERKAATALSTNELCCTFAHFLTK